MDILPTAPFRVASLLWQPRREVHVLAVICKATFALTPGECTPALDEDPPNEADNHWNDDEGRSLYTASDLAPFKRHADIVLIGHAHAPHGHPVSSLVTRLATAGVDKSIEVHADRVWTRDGQILPGAPFVRMPLRWERAAGGPENPVGVHVGAQTERQGQVVALPNLQPPGLQVRWPGREIPPIGYGPIAPTWPSRRAKLQSHAAGWDHQRWAERPLPEDVDGAFFNVAPLDQQVAEIRPDEGLLLENMLPDQARLVTRLPGLWPRVAVARGGVAQVVRMRCDTLSIDTDRGVCSLVWRGQVALASATERGRVFITAEREVAPRDEAAMTLALAPAAGTGAALPFRAVPTATGSDEPAPEEDAARMTLPLMAPKVTPVLPFQEGSPWSAAALGMGEAAAPREEGDGTGTVFGASPGLAEVLPFLRSLQAPEEPLEQETARLVWTRPAAAAPEEEDDEAAVPTVPPPAMIGPLATAEMGDKAAAKVEEAAPAARVEDAAAAPREPAPADLPIEQVAEIQAEIAEERSARVEVLDGRGLTEEVWAATEQRWVRALEEEAGRGSSTLRRASDAAYVAAVERLRGPITGEEYARILIGLERGRAAEELDALRIQRPALMRIVRVWTKKVAGDARLGREVRAVMAGMRVG